MVMSLRERFRTYAEGYDIEMLRTRAAEYLALSETEDDEDISFLTLGISVLFEYIADMKEPCDPGDVTCLEHKKKNCQCLDGGNENG